MTSADDPVAPDGLPCRTEVVVALLLASPRHRYEGRPADGALPADPSAPELRDRVELRAGLGIVGDRYFAARAHVHASVTRQGVTIIEVVGDVTAALPVPEPYAVRQFWYKFLPAVSGEGFDAGPFLVTLHQTMKPETCERVEGKLVLRDLPGTPVADLPVLELEGSRFMMTSSEFFHVLEDVEIDPEAYARHVRVQYT